MDGGPAIVVKWCVCVEYEAMCNTVTETPGEREHGYKIWISI